MLSVNEIKQALGDYLTGSGATQHYDVGVAKTKLYGGGLPDDYDPDGFIELINNAEDGEAVLDNIVEALIGLFAFCSGINDPTGTDIKFKHRFVFDHMMAESSSETLDNHYNDNNYIIYVESRDAIPAKKLPSVWTSNSWEGVILSTPRTDDDGNDTNQLQIGFAFAQGIRIFRRTRGASTSNWGDWVEISGGNAISIADKTLDENFVAKRLRAVTAATGAQKFYRFKDGYPVAAVTDTTAYWRHAYVAVEVQIENSSTVRIDYIRKTPLTYDSDRDGQLYEIELEEVPASSVDADHYAFVLDAHEENVTNRYILENRGAYLLEWFYNAAYYKLSAAPGTGASVAGKNTLATGTASHADGIGTIAKGSAQAVFGKYNALDNDALFVVGSGDNEDDRRNAFVVKEDGVYINGEKGTTDDAFNDLLERALSSAKQLVTPNYVGKMINGGTSTPPAWSNEAVYAIDDLVMYTDGSKTACYKCVSAVGPSEQTPKADTTNWTKADYPTLTDLESNRFYAIQAESGIHNLPGETFNIDAVNGDGNGLRGTFIWLDPLFYNTKQYSAALYLTDNNLYSAFKSSSNPRLEWKKNVVEDDMTALLDSDAVMAGKSLVTSSFVWKQATGSSAPQWVKTNNYSVDAMVSKSVGGVGTFFKCIQAITGSSTNQNPENDPTHWEKQAQPSVTLLDLPANKFFAVQETCGIHNMPEETFSVDTVNGDANGVTGSYICFDPLFNANGLYKICLFITDTYIYYAFKGAGGNRVVWNKATNDALGGQGATLPLRSEATEGTIVLLGDSICHGVGSTGNNNNGQVIVPEDDMVFPFSSGLWGSKFKYAADDYVYFGNRYYQCIEAIDAVPKWDKAGIYNLDMLVTHNTEYYYCKKEVFKPLDTAPSADTEHWSTVPDWDSTAAYAINNYVKYSNNYYKCKAAVSEGTTNPNPASDNTHWTLVPNSVADIPATDSSHWDDVPMWRSTTSYANTNTYVQFGRCLMRNTAVTTAQSAAPDADTTHWQDWEASLSTWNSTATYSRGAIVKKEIDGELHFYAWNSSTPGSGGNGPGADTTNWTDIGDSIPVWSNELTYAEGATVKWKHRDNGVDYWYYYRCVYPVVYPMLSAYMPYRDPAHWTAEAVPTWSGGDAYVVGNFVRYNGKYYRCVSPVTTPTKSDPFSDADPVSNVPKWTPVWIGSSDNKNYYSNKRRSTSADSWAARFKQYIESHYRNGSRVRAWNKTTNYFKGQRVFEQVQHVATEWSSDSTYRAYDYVYTVSGTTTSYYRCRRNIDTPTATPPEEGADWTVVTGTDVAKYYDTATNQEAGRYYDCVNDIAGVSDIEAGYLPENDTYHQYWDIMPVATETPDVIPSYTPLLKVNNNGIGSWDTKALIANLDNLLPYNTRMVIVNIGTNDRNQNYGDLRRWYGELFDAIRDWGAKRTAYGVEIIAMSPIDVLENSSTYMVANTMARVNALLENVCREKSVHYVNLYSEWNGAIATSSYERNEFYNDFAHPSPFGHKAMFGLVCKLLNF